jgi:hypothetical protein
MALIDDLQSLATELLNDPDFSQGIITYVRITPGSGPADNPGAPVETIFATKGVARGVSSKYVQNSLALMTDLQVTLPIIDGVTPHGRDVITIDGVRYKIVHIEKIPAAGTVAAYKFIVRK